VVLISKKPAWQLALVVAWAAAKPLLAASWGQDRQQRLLVTGCWGLAGCLAWPGEQGLMEIPLLGPRCTHIMQVVVLYVRAC